MDTYYTIEEKYLQAVDEVCFGEIPKGLKLLNEIICNDLFYARAHYQVGKIYYYEIKDYQTAGFHFKTCLELEPSFPDVYFHFMHLVVFMNMEKQVFDIATKALTTQGVNSADIYTIFRLCFSRKIKIGLKPWLLTEMRLSKLPIKSKRNISKTVSSG